ncbi:hypothetical protein [uncultured Sphaerochaeta sp.]|uniref:hypothetical protein n=1 Tax=uncultured Sphaerochaeta sp. TaxID=886478 RepID=UPI0029CA4957|nr:hypothetical protein [uncultured Sphaerochaeta sp.]
MQHKQSRKNKEIKMATNVQKLIASAGGRYMTITPASVGVTSTDCMLVALDGETVLYRFPVGAEAQEVDLELIGDCFFICAEQEYSYSRSATSNVAVGGDLSIAGTLKMILLELKKKLANINLALAGFKNVSDAQAVEIEALETRAGEIEDDIASIQNGIVALETLTSGQGISIAENASAISALEELTDGYKAGLQTEVDALGVTVSGHTTSIAGLQTEVDALEELTDGYKAGLQAEVDALGVTVSGHTTSIAGLQTEVDALEVLTDGYKAGLQADVDALGVTVASQGDAIQVHEEEIGVMGEMVGNHITWIQALQSDVQSLQTLTAGINSTIQTTVNTLVTDVDSLEVRLTTLENEDADDDGRLVILETAKADLTTRMATSESDIDALQVLTSGHALEIEDLQTDLSALQGTVENLELGADAEATAQAINDLTASDSALSVRVSAVETALPTKAPVSHTHDDRYYTESEVNTKLAGKSDVHSHPYAPSSHSHNYQEPVKYGTYTINTYNTILMSSLGVGCKSVNKVSKPNANESQNLTLPAGGTYSVIAMSKTETLTLVEIYAGGVKFPLPQGEFILEVTRLT